MKIEKKWLDRVGLKIIDDRVTTHFGCSPKLLQIKSLGDIIKHNIIAEDDKNIRGLIEYYTHLTAKLTGALIFLSCVVVFEFLWFIGG